MARIIETIVEPSKIYTGSLFKLKIKVSNTYLVKQTLITENRKVILTEDGVKIRTEWGE